MTIKAAVEVAERGALPYIEDEEVENDAKATKRESSYLLFWRPTPLVTPTSNQVKATLAASYHWATTGTQYVIEWKAKLLKRATFSFCLGLVILVVGLTIH